MYQASGVSARYRALSDEELACAMAAALFTTSPEKTVSEDIMHARGLLRAEIERRGKTLVAGSNGRVWLENR